MGMVLLSLGGLASLACFVIVLIKMFQTEKPLHGILGIVTCGIWAFIWGWMNATKHNLKKIMLIWTVAIVVNSIGYAMFMGSAVAEAQRQMQQGAPPTTVSP